MPQKDWYGQFIMFLILLFLACSALGIVYSDLAPKHPSRDPAAAEALHCLTFPVDYPAAEALDAEFWRPVVLLENLGAREATIEITLHDANGTELSGTFAEGRLISLPAGESATVPLADVEGLPAGHYSVTLSSNEPITGTVVHQATAGEVQNSDL